MGGKGRRMAGLQDAMFFMIDKGAFLLGKGPPQHEDDMLFFLSDCFNDIVGEF